MATSGLGLHALMMMKSLLVLLVMTVSRGALAAEWTPIPQHADAFINLPSIKSERFPLVVAAGETVNMVNGHMPSVIYRVAWLLIEQETLEVVFDCDGGIAAMQQIVRSDAPASEYHSFDQTDAFRARGVTFRDFAPGSVMEGASVFVCTK